MSPILGAIASMFIDQGLGLLAGAVQGNGEKAVKFIEKKTGIDIKDIAGSKTDSYLTTENIKALKSLESTERVELARMGYADVADARQHDIEVRKMSGLNIRADAMLIAAFVAVVAIACILALTDIKENGIVIGFLTTIGGMFARNIGTAFDFEYGSSRGSKEKNLINGSA